MFNIEFDEKFWVGFSVILFVVLVYKPLKNVILNALDNHIATTSKNLSEAKKLMQEAEALLEEYKHKQQQVRDQVDEIIKESDKQVENFIARMEKEIQNAIEKKTDAVMQRIFHYESMILEDVRKHSVDVAICAVKSLLADKISREDAENALLDLSGKLNLKN